MDFTILCLIGAVVLVALAILASAIRIVPEYQRLVLFRLGRAIGARGPGLVLLIPIIDRAVSVDLREQVREIPHQTSITRRQRFHIAVDFIWYYKRARPDRRLSAGRQLRSGCPGYMAITTLRSVIGGISAG
jgi:regulator of protease activity HflC (stomatin/prohibitin superfamily)